MYIYIICVLCYSIERLNKWQQAVEVTADKKRRRCIKTLWRCHPADFNRAWLVGSFAPTKLCTNQAVHQPSWGVTPEAEERLFPEGRRPSGKAARGRPLWRSGQLRRSGLQQSVIGGQAKSGTHMCSVSPRDRPAQGPYTNTSPNSSAMGHCNPSPSHRLRHCLNLEGHGALRSRVLRRPLGCDAGSCRAWLVGSCAPTKLCTNQAGASPPGTEESRPSLVGRSATHRNVRVSFPLSFAEGMGQDIA